MDNLIFQSFDETRAVSKAHGTLPHWTQEGAVHFVTFRQHDSLPAGVAERWQAERKEWLALRGESPDDEGWFERLAPDHRREYGRRFGQVIQEEMDRGAGSCLLAKKENADIMAAAMKHFDSERYRLGDYVVMPNHVHVLMIPFSGWSVGDILKSWKNYTARLINQREGLSGSFWQRESFDHIVRNRKQLDRIRAYIAENPVKARLVPGSYRIYAPEWAK